MLHIVYSILYIRVSFQPHFISFIIIIFISEGEVFVIRFVLQRRNKPVLTF